MALGRTKFRIHSVADGLCALFLVDSFFLFFSFFFLFLFLRRYDVCTLRTRCVQVSPTASPVATFLSRPSRSEIRVVFTAHSLTLHGCILAYIDTHMGWQTTRRNCAATERSRP